MLINKKKIEEYFNNFNIDNNHPVVWMKRIYSGMIGISWSIRLMILFILVILILMIINLIYVITPSNKSTSTTNAILLSRDNVSDTLSPSPTAQNRGNNVFIHISDGNSISRYLSYILRDRTSSGISREGLAYIYYILLPSQLSKINYTRSEEGYDEYLSISEYVHYLSVVISELRRHDPIRGRVGKMHIEWLDGYRDISELSIRGEVQLKDDYINYSLGIMQLTDSIIEARGHYRSGIKKFYSSRLSEYDVQQGLLRLDDILD